ncbi:MAG: hypothetical protein LUI10_04575 [Lachnospiraceae bacterium]|nr:hypothetical protein [Lachnospiraceae bacterium]
MSEKAKDVLIRAAKTFVQAALSIAVAQLAGLDFTGVGVSDALLNIAIAAGAAGISAVWNGVLSPLLGDNNNEEVG